MRKIVLAMAGGLCLASWQQPAQADRSEACAEPIARVVSVQGSVEIKAAAGDDWRPARLNEALCAGDLLRTGARSRSAILLLDIETVTRVDQNTRLSIESLHPQERSLMTLFEGALNFLSRVPRTLEIHTPFVNAGIEGTEVFIEVRPRQRNTVVSVFEGQVAASRQAEVFEDPDRFIWTSGQSGIGAEGEAPRRLDPASVADRALWRFLVQPRDAVQWTVYYRPLLGGLADSSRAGAARPALREALDAQGRGDIGPAFDRLDRVPPAERDDLYQVVLAQLLLSVGRVEEARDGLAKALDANPNSGEALALRAVVSVAHNEPEQALSFGRRAVEASPRSAAAKIALSYARQANFQLEAARDTLLEAVGDEPDNGLAWARLAEVRMSLGYLGMGLEAAEAASEKAPELGLTHILLGFAKLARFDLSGAKAAFERGIARDSANATGWLGLGLAKIRGGDLAEGRQDIEIAAGLSPNLAIARSYLGKAYFEEKRDELAAREFDRAKQEDPRDPTAFLYDAILKQSQNRPVEALRNITRSIELNDNRAVYRSRELLDEDLAVRGASLGRIYNDLGFDRMAIIEGARSLDADPANHSAHWLLSDSYAGVQRHEIARVSELLRAQLLQPVQIRPVGPRQLETDLNLLPGVGPAENAFNEYASAFSRDGLRLTATGLVGNQDTFGDEVVLSGQKDRFAFSLGQFHISNDGFRDNNDVEHDIYDVFAQVALAPWLDVQAEYRRRETDEGDIDFDFDPDVFSRLDRRDIEQDSFRLGAHIDPDPMSDILLSFIYSDREEQLAQFGPPDVDATVDLEGYDAQAQYIFNARVFNLTAGAGLYQFDRDSRDVVDISAIPPGCPPLPVCIFDTSEKDEIDQHNAYLYGNANWPQDVTWTLGLSYDSYDDGTIDIGRINPKFGVQWDITRKVRLRAAYFKTVKRELVVDQTLEPTNVAGFNQFFDDFNGTKTERFGIGLDATITPDLHAGVEFSRRNLQVPSALVGGGSITEDEHEDLYRGYLYWTPWDQLALSAEALFDGFDRDSQAAVREPEEVHTFSVPLEARYFHPSGLFAALGVTPVWQDIHFEIGAPRHEQTEFAVVDAAVGFRLPKRRGIVTFEVSNLFDTKIDFQDDNFRSSESSNPRFVPERTFMLRGTINF